MVFTDNCRISEQDSVTGDEYAARPDSDMALLYRISLNTPSAVVPAFFQRSGANQLWPGRTAAAAAAVYI